MPIVKNKMMKIKADTGMIIYAIFWQIFNLFDCLFVSSISWKNRQKEWVCCKVRTLNHLGRIYHYFLVLIHGWEHLILSSITGLRSESIHVCVHQYQQEGNYQVEYQPDINHLQICCGWQPFIYLKIHIRCFNDILLSLSTYTDKQSYQNQHGCEIDTNYWFIEFILVIVSADTDDVEKEGGNNDIHEDTEELSSTTAYFSSHLVRNILVALTSYLVKNCSPL